jgi:hypothetical protein
MKKFTKIHLLRMIVKQKNNIDYMESWNHKVENNLVPKINPISQRTNMIFREWDFEKCEKIIEKCVTLIKSGSYK